MITEIKKPDTIQFCFRMERSDELHHRCLWARITFDNKNWSMMAQSDCGDYSYSWKPESGNRSFLQLMSQIDEQYLLSKISNMSKFDFEQSKENVLRYISGCEDFEKMKVVLDDMSNAGDSEFLRDLDTDEFIGVTDLWECIEYDYPAGAKTFAEMFVKCVQPEIRKYIASVN